MYDGIRVHEQDVVISLEESHDGAHVLSKGGGRNKFGASPWLGSTECIRAADGHSPHKEVPLLK